MLGGGSGTVSPIGWLEASACLTSVRLCTVWQRGRSMAYRIVRSAGRFPRMPEPDNPAQSSVQAAAFGLDALAVGDRFKLFNFTRRGDHYLWILRAMDRLREARVPQAHTDDVARALVELSVDYPDAPRTVDNLRACLDQLADENEDRVLHRLEDAARTGSLAGYRNRQSVYQFSDLGYSAYLAVEAVLGARFEDANLSRLIVSDILRDLNDLAKANREGNGPEVARRLRSLDAAVEDMARRSARFHLALGEIMRSSDTSPEKFLEFKKALLVHMNDFMAELDRYLPRLSDAVTAVEATGIATLLNRAAEADDRPFMRIDALIEDWRRRWFAARAWFAPDEAGRVPRTEQLREVTGTAVSSVLALLRQITETQRRGVNRGTELRHLAAWVFDCPDDEAAHALMAAAFNVRSARHLGGVHEDEELIPDASTWWQAPGVEVSVSLFRKGRVPKVSPPQKVAERNAVRAALREKQQADRAAERAATERLVAEGPHDIALDEEQVGVLLKLLTRALESRTVVAGRLVGSSCATDVAVMRLSPSPTGSTVRTPTGTLYLAGFQVEIKSARDGRILGANVTEDSV